MEKDHTSLTDPTQIPNNEFAFTHQNTAGLKLSCYSEANQS